MSEKIDKTKPEECNINLCRNYSEQCIRNCQKCVGVDDPHGYPWDFPISCDLRDKITALEAENKELKEDQTAGVRLMRSVTEKLQAVGGNLENHKIMVKDLREKNDLLKQGLKGEKQ